MNSFLIVIPARYKSTRFPGKPLVNIMGKSMIKHVWEKCVQASDREKVLVATDDYRIVDHCNENNINVSLTRKTCKTGTDRIYDIAKKKKKDIYINVQGDEPLVLSSDIKKIIDVALENPKITINAMCKIDNNSDYINPNIPKVVTTKDGGLLFISRAPIPSNKSKSFIRAMKQVCIYSFPYDVLMDFGTIKEKTPLENIEDIEILRLLELGHKVKMIEVSGSSIAVDTPEDLDKVRKEMNDKFK